MNKALSGVGVLVTRPLGQAAGLMRRLAELGACPVSFPALAIRPVATTALNDLEHHDLAIFVSPTAVEQGMAVLGRPWPASLTAAGVGAGTARALRDAGVTNILCPAQGADSEHLLALPALTEGIAGKRVLIIRGESGRETLADILSARGATIAHAICYRRARADSDPATLIAALDAEQIQAVTAMSSETLDFLLDLAGETAAPQLRTLPLFAPHARIATHARELGWATAVATAPGEAGLVAGLMEYFAHD